MRDSVLECPDRSGAALELLWRVLRGDLLGCDRTFPTHPEPRGEDRAEEDHDNGDWPEVLKMLDEVTEAVVLDERVDAPFRKNAGNECEKSADDCRRRRPLSQRPTRCAPNQDARQRERVEALPHDPQECKVADHSSRDGAKHRHDQVRF